MAPEDPLVSVIIIFKNEERFLAEAIQSVVAQTYQQWELLLVDDGSVDASTNLARDWAARHRPRILYLDHPGHANRGMSASRNLGLAAGTGSLVAFLDADDVWLPAKLAIQVKALDRHREAALTYGPLLRWRSWTGKAADADADDLMGVGRRKHGRHPLAGRVAEPPALVRLMLADDYFIPGGALFRRQALDEVGRFEDRFAGMYEDAVVMMKLCLRYPVLVTDDVGYLYRIHDRSCTHLNRAEHDADTARAAYLAWLGRHLDDTGTRTPALTRALARARRSTSGRRRRRQRARARLRTLGRHLLPGPVRRRLRARWRDGTGPPRGPG